MAFVWWLTTVFFALVFFGALLNAISAYKARTIAMTTESLYQRWADLAKKIASPDLTEEEDGE